MYPFLAGGNRYAQMDGQDVQLLGDNHGHSEGRPVQNIW